MLRKTAFLLTAGLASIALGVGALAAGGAGDPLVSLSYLKEIYSTPMEQKAQARAISLYDDAVSRFNVAYDAARNQALSKVGDEQALKGTIAKAVVEQMSGSQRRNVTLSKGDLVSGPPGSGAIVLSGSAQVSGSQVINIPLGRSAKDGEKANVGVYFMVAQDGSGLRVTSDTATLQIFDGARAQAAQPPYAPQYEPYAQALSGMRLFNGSNLGFELERQPTRQESLIMLIRLLGEEPDALAFTGKSSFTDLAGWADGIKYVAYGEYRKYTNGVTATTFAQQSPASADMYLTYLLRALGYSDAEGDFIWNQTSGALAVELGLLTQGQLDGIKSTGFKRDHVALLSYNALNAQMKDGTGTLAHRLIEQGVITQAQLDESAAQLQK